MKRINLTNPDTSHLRTLAICYYAIASMSAISGCVLLGFAMVGVAMMLGMFDVGPPEAAVFFGLIITVMELLLALFVFTMCFLEALTGRSLATHKRYRLCFVVACIELLNVPLGTTLAIFTIIVLQRPSVRDLFAGAEYHDPRLDALGAFDDEKESVPAPSRADDGGAIREGSD